MVISFTGINNVVVKKKSYTNIGSYPDKLGGISWGNKDYTEIKISANFTDDQNGNHLSELRKSFPKRYLDENNPDKVELHIKRFVAGDEEAGEIPIEVTTFKVNNKDLVINDYNKLDMMSFLAKFTRESSKNQEFSKEKRKFLIFANSQIHKETVFAINSDLCSPKNKK